jgi:putative ABC transport system permease protein
VASYREQQENLSEQFVRTENFLSLTGLLILVLGGIGVWNVARAFIEQKRKTVAVLKCLGASGNKVIAVYLLQIMFLGMAGSLFGVLLAQLALWFTQWRFGAELPVRMTYTVNTSTVWQGLFLGLSISVLFSLLPLLHIRQIKPRLLLRDENNTSVNRLDRSKWLIGAFSLVGLLGLAVWQAGSLKVGAFFLGGLFATALILYLAATVLTRLLRRIRGVSSFTIKQAINSLYRPGNQTRIVLLAVGLGAFVVMTVQIMQTNLISEFDVTRNGRLPSLLFVDVQKSQIKDVVSTITERIGEEPQSIPTVRGRIAFINGQPFDYQQREVRQQQGIIGREFALTYRPNLDENETVVAGEWWNGDAAPDLPQVSVEEDMADLLKVEPGDSISFNVSGRTLTARVANIREIDLRNTRTAFVFVFQPGMLEDAPQTFAATVLKHAPATDRQRLQREIVDKFPNVQIFDVADILATVQRLINNFVLAISFVGSFVMLSGILILMGSIALTKSQRIYESAILKTLGADRKALTGMLVAEYLMLGALAGAIGAVFATALSFAVSRYLMSIEWTFQPLLTAIGIAVTALAVAVVGVAGSFDVLFRKPLATLRSQ